MATLSPDKLWHKLIYEKIPYEEEFFSDFVDQKTELVDHLNACKRCRGAVNGLYPNVKAPSFKNMSDDDFLAGIRDLRDRAMKQQANKPKTP